MSRSVVEQVLVTQVATSPNCGNLLKLYLPTQLLKDAGGQAKALRTVTMIWMYNGLSATKLLSNTLRGRFRDQTAVGSVSLRYSPSGDKRPTDLKREPAA
jgi:hypothetical protein